MMCNRAWSSGSKCSSFRSLLFKSSWVNSDLQWTRPYGNLVPRSPHIRKPGDPASVSCLLCLTHIGNSQGPFTGDCHSYEIQVGQEIYRDAQHPPKVTLASCACPWTSSLPDTCYQKSLSDGKHPRFFFPSFQAPAQPPTSRPSYTSPSFQEHLCIPSYISPTPTYSLNFWMPPSSSSHLSP